MGVLWSICLILCGCLAASALIVKKQPNAKELIDKLVPIQGYLGIALLLLGIWSLIIVATHFHAGLASVIALLIAICMIALGFLLGYGLINQFALSKNPEAAAKGAEIQAKLTTYQIPLGVIGIALGVWGLIMNIMH